jgi:hypothetical protein
MTLLLVFGIKFQVILIHFTYLSGHAKVSNSAHTHLIHEHIL